MMGLYGAGHTHRGVVEGMNMVEEIGKVFSKKHNFLYFSFDYVKRDKIWLVVKERNFQHMPRELVAV